MKEINYYLIPGMGADHRIYQRFELQHGNMHFLDWINPDKARDMQEFARIIAEQIQTENNVLVGSSMGGMMAVELSRIVKPRATILISAPTGVHQFPRILKVVKSSRIHRVVRPSVIPSLYRLADTFMGFKDENQRRMFYEMMSNLGPEFIHFSVNAVLDWKNRQPPEGKYLQIVGSKDVLFDYKKMENPVVLEGGGHFSCYDRSEEICSIINSFVEKEILASAT